jgi:DNA-binding PadR family transcriptional regulator
VRSKDLKRTILKILDDGGSYGYDVHRKLMREGVRIEISRLYRVLNEMLKENYLVGRWEKSVIGPRRRVYRVGKRGAVELNIILLEAIGTVHEYYGKYLMGLPAKINALNRICRSLTRGLGQAATIGYLASEYSPFHEKLIPILCDEVPEGKVYFIKPASLRIELEIENLSSLDGTRQNIPLKNGHVDALLVIDVPPKKQLKNSVREWHRIVGRNGRLGILAPTALINKIRDPLTIGDFMEKYEHESAEGNEKFDRESFETMLSESFQKIEAREIAIMTLVLASEPRPPPSF